mgnify:CR=1 FL=1
MIQGGDPTGTGRGGESAWEVDSTTKSIQVQLFTKPAIKLERWRWRMRDQIQTARSSLSCIPTIHSLQLYNLWQSN